MIFFDMDGVIADWDNEASFEDTFRPRYFLDRTVAWKVRELVNLLIEKGYPVAFLSAVYMEGTARDDKDTWLNRLGFKDVPKFFVPYGDTKAHYVQASPKNILIDDFTKNLIEWEEAGFTGIKYYNQFNGTRHQWNGYSISHKMSVDKMATIVMAVADSLETKN